MSRTASRVLAVSLLVAVAAGFLAPTVRGEAADWVRQQSFKLLNEGVAAVNRGDYKEAIEKLTDCARMSLNSFRAHFYLGLALIGDRRYADAVDVLNIALDLDPTHLRAHVALGDAFLNQGDTDEAKAEYFRALKLRPEYPQALDGVGRIYEAKAEDDKAEAFYLRAIESNRGYADAYTHLGDFYLERGRLDEAVELLVEAVSIRPDFGPGLNRLALAYARLGLHNEAVSTIQEAIEIEPTEPDHRATLGHIELELGLMTSAEESFAKALELDPAHPAASGGMAELARRKGDYDSAVLQLEQALDDERLNSRERRWFEQRLAEIVEERDRVAEIRTRLDAGEATSDDYRALARIYANRRMWDEAADLYFKSEPSGAEAERLAYYLLQSGRYRAAYLLYAEMAAEGRRADLEVNAGVALARLGDDGQARAAYDRALEIDPDHLLARLYLANSLLRLGKTDEAIAAYKAYLAGGGDGEAAERARRILEHIAPETVAQEPVPEIPALIEGDEEEAPPS